MVVFHFFFPLTFLHFEFLHMLFSHTYKLFVVCFSLLVLSTHFKGIKSGIVLSFDIHHLLFKIIALGLYEMQFLFQQSFVGLGLLEDLFVGFLVAFESLGESFVFLGKRLKFLLEIGFQLLLVLFFVQTQFLNFLFEIRNLGL